MFPSLEICLRYTLNYSMFVYKRQKSLQLSRLYRRERFTDPFPIIGKGSLIFIPHAV